MAPYVTSTPTGVLFEDDTPEENVVMDAPKEKYEIRYVWRNVIIFVFLYLGAFYGLYLVFTSAKLITFVFAFTLYTFSVMGVTVGAHRLWSHKSFKAKWPLQVLLMIWNTIAFQDPAIHWARDHRVHHKYSETNADPHNAKRGFFFAHVGWLMCRKHPDVKEKGKGIDISDLEKNSVLMFQKRYYMVLMPVLCFVMPTVLPVLCWNETWSNAFFVPTILRYVVVLNTVWLINSAAHLYGNKPYDKTSSAILDKDANITVDEGIPIYNSVSSCQNPITFGGYVKLCETFGLEIPSMQCIWYNMLILNRHLIIHKVCDFLFQFLPAIIVDTFAYIVGRKPMLLDVYKKIQNFGNVLQYFTTQEWDFCDDNVQKLWQGLNSADKRIFQFSIKNLDWNEYIYGNVRGARMYLLKDSPDTIEAARRRHQKLKIAHYTITTLTILLMLWVTVHVISFLWSQCPLAH